MHHSDPHAIVTTAALAILVMMACAWSFSVHAEVKRCVLPSGEHVYTDRRCDDVGAVPRRPRADTSGTTASRLYRSGCVRNLRDLTYQLASAIGNRDVNALAALYHWPGMSTSAATATMRQLDAIVQRPLVDIDLIFAAGPSTNDLNPPTATEQAPMPTGLRVRQTLVNAATPSQTGFGVRRHMGCWWLQF